MVLDDESYDTAQSRIVFDSLIESGVNQFADVRNAGHTMTINWIFNSHSICCLATSTIRRRIH